MSDTPNFSQLRLGLCWLLKPPHEYAHTLSLKLPQFCCSGRHSFGEDSPYSPYLLQVINPSFSHLWLGCVFGLTLLGKEPVFRCQLQIDTCQEHCQRLKTKTFAICLCRDWTLWCWSCWPSTPPQVLQGGKRYTVKPAQPISLFAFLFLGDGFDQHLLYNVTNLHS